MSPVTGQFKKVEVIQFSTILTDQLSKWHLSTLNLFAVIAERLSGR